MNNSPAALRCEQLSKHFQDGKRDIMILDQVDLSIAPGERVAIIGPSGSGKSTLLQLLGGLDLASSGDVFINGQSVQALNAEQRGRLRNQHLGFIYQFHHLLPEFTALENVCMPLLLRHLPLSDIEQQATEILKQVGLQHRLTHRLAELSGGERQRVAIARALVTGPSCVLADEPTGNLDPQTATQVYETMLALNAALKTSLVIVTHDHELANRMDRVLRLEHGQLTEQRGL